MDSEIWKDIDGYEGRYQVSNMGNVRSLYYHNTKGIVRVKCLKPATDKKGYLRCALSKSNKLVTYKIHRLVATAFIPNPENLPQVNHINGDKSDNRIGNLEWCNNSQNQIHAYKNGLNAHSEKSGRTKKPIILICKATGETFEYGNMTEAARDKGLGRRALHNILYDNPTYTHKGFYARFK